MATVDLTAKEEYTCIWRSSRESIWKASSTSNTPAAGRVRTETRLQSPRSTHGEKPGSPGVFGISRFRRTRSTLSIRSISARHTDRICAAAPADALPRSQCESCSRYHTRYRVNHPALARELAKLNLERDSIFFLFWTETLTSVKLFRSSDIL